MLVWPIHNKHVSARMRMGLIYIVQHASHCGIGLAVKGKQDIKFDLHLDWGNLQ